MAYTLVDPTDEESLTRILERLPKDGQPEELALSTQVEVEETPPWEAKAMARTLDFQKRKADPNTRGIPREKRKSSSSKGKKASGESAADALLQGRISLAMV